MLVKRQTTDEAMMMALPDLLGSEHVDWLPSVILVTAQMVVLLRLEIFAMIVPDIPHTLLDKPINMM